MEKRLIEKEDWKFYLYETENGIELNVPIGEPAPGFDVIHFLTEDEVRIFNEKGVKSLEKRIENMREEFTKYQLNSWR